MAEDDISVPALSVEEEAYYQEIIEFQLKLQRELEDANASLTKELRSVVSLLFILVGIDVLRIVKAWSVSVRGGEYHV